MADNIKSIQIFGSIYSNHEIDSLCEEKINDVNVDSWEKDIYFFIRNWFSKSDRISVKTSGSTGPPKLIELQKKHMITSAKATLKFFGLVPNNTAWLCIPITYIAGKMVVVRSIVGGLNLIYSEPNANPSIVVNNKIDFAAMVPNQVFGLMESNDSVDVLSHINHLLIGGSLLSKVIENRLLNYNNFNAWHSYAMTETITHIALRKIGHNSYMGDFYPLDGVKVNQDKENKLVINYPAIGVSDLVTNDIVKLFSDGSFTILGRSDNIVVSGGVKLFPELIESVIGESIKKEFFIGGIYDDKLGEKLVLFIEGDSYDINISDLQKIGKGVLNKYEMPKDIIFMKEFTRTQSGKIMRRESVEAYSRLSN